MSRGHGGPRPPGPVVSCQACHGWAHSSGAEGTASHAEPGALRAAAEGSPCGLRRSSEVGGASRLGLERGARRGNRFSSFVAQASLAGKGEAEGRNSLFCFWIFAGLRRSAETVWVRVHRSLIALSSEAESVLSDPAALPAEAEQWPPPLGCWTQWAQVVQLGPA